MATPDAPDDQRLGVEASTLDTHDETAPARSDADVERISAELVDGFDQVTADEIEQDVRAEFGRWSSSPVQDFVPIFVTRAVRQRLRTPGMQESP